MKATKIDMLLHRKPRLGPPDRGHAELGREHATQQEHAHAAQRRRLVQSRLKLSGLVDAKAGAVTTDNKDRRKRQRDKDRRDDEQFYTPQGRPRSKAFVPR